MPAKHFLMLRSAAQQRVSKHENNYKLGLTVIQLSATISLLTAVRTDVSIDSWSTVDWFLASLWR